MRRPADRTPLLETVVLDDSADGDEEETEEKDNDNDNDDYGTQTHRLTSWRRRMTAMTVVARHDTRQLPQRLVWNFSASWEPSVIAILSRRMNARRSIAEESD